jgi:hypothetical protein
VPGDVHKRQARSMLRIWTGIDRSVREKSANSGPALVSGLALLSPDLREIHLPELCRIYSLCMYVCRIFDIFLCFSASLLSYKLRSRLDDMWLHGGLKQLLLNDKMASRVAKSVVDTRYSLDALKGPFPAVFWSIGGVLYPREFSLGLATGSAGFRYDCYGNRRLVTRCNAHGGKLEEVLMLLTSWLTSQQKGLSGTKISRAWMFRHDSKTS